MQLAPGLGAQSCPQSARTAPLSAERLPSAERESSLWMTEVGFVRGQPRVSARFLTSVKSPDKPARRTLALIGSHAVTRV